MESIRPDVVAETTLGRTIRVEVDGWFMTGFRIGGKGIYKGIYNLVFAATHPFQIVP